MVTGFLVTTLPLTLRQPEVKTFGLVKFSDWFRRSSRDMQNDIVVLLLITSSLKTTHNVVNRFVYMDCTTYTYFFNRVAADWISQVFLCIFKPAVKSRSLLGKQQEQVLHLEYNRQRSLSVTLLYRKQKTTTTTTASKH